MDLPILVLDGEFQSLVPGNLSSPIDCCGLCIEDTRCPGVAWVFDNPALFVRADEQLVRHRTYVLLLLISQTRPKGVVPLA